MEKSEAQREWDELIEAAVAAGKTRAQAVIDVSRRHPELRQQLVAEANA
jgi:hypothetical protein